MKIPILATGLSGMIGSRVRQLLGNEMEFTDLSLSSGTDITDYDQVEKKVKSSPAKVILHLAAKTNVDECEDDKLLEEDGAAWQVNVVGTQNLVKMAQKTGKKVIYISTDFVFNGAKNEYFETDKPNPLNWYGYTKFEGEERVLNGNINFAIVRIAYPYGLSAGQKKDFVGRILDTLRSGKEIRAVTDHIFTPTYTDDIAQVLGFVIKNNATGILHAVGSQSLTTLEAVNLIAKAWGIKANISEVTRNEFFRDRAFRPGKLVLKSDRITELGINMRGFEEGLTDIKKHLKHES